MLHRLPLSDSTQTTTSLTIRHARPIWTYLQSDNWPEPSDAIVVCCSYDLDVCDHACELLRASLAPVIVFSGKRGNWTSHLWESPEAQVFRERAEANGIASSSFLIEEKATNIGENIDFSDRAVPEARAVTFVIKSKAILQIIPLRFSV